ncbi:hypothetical protein L1049_000513 [Liquidambar formosana]|uniref:Wound-responsive family protein n=1 Tax=Liquidambar formosana TaxID=63359 RepID=A0AAP0R2Z7_LIQFO
MSYSGRAWMVAASIGAVEALKDQLGLCRWNYPLRALQQHAKNNIRSYYQAKKLSASSASAMSKKMRDDKMKRREDSMRKVMDLSCWGPNSVRF